MRLPVPLLLTILAMAVAVLLGLGTWQVQRSFAKDALVRERATRLAAPPVEGIEAGGREPSNLAWRRVQLTGTWDHSHSLVLANRVRYGVKGEELVTPLLPDGGGPGVLVNRGWYPDAERARVRAALDAQARAEVEGLAVDGSGRTARQTAQGTWTGLAPASVAAAEGIALQPWFVLQGVPAADGTLGPGVSLPVQRYRPFANTTPHIEYALTWYGIAAVLVGIAFARFVIAPRRARRSATPGP